MRARTSSTPDDAKRVTMQVSTAGIVCNAALTVFKLVAGIVAHSSAIVADAVHSASDILGSLIVMIGAVFSHKAADASHPYAVNVSENAMAAAKALGLPYLRYERSLSELDYDNIHIVHSYEAAAEMAASLGNTIFLTTGSRNLKKFAEAPALQEKTIVARVLPTPDVIAQCIDLGIAPGQIVALQGPFSEALNRELFLRYHADVIVTKNSGDIGGTDTKLAAAKALHLPVVLIDRPKMEYPAVAHMMEDVADWLHC